MGYPSAARLCEIVSYCDKFLPHVKTPSLLELGDQTLLLKETDINHLKKFFEKFGLGEKLEKYRSRIGDNIWVSDLYEEVGFEFHCLDLNGNNNAIKIDLNFFPNPALDRKSVV